MFEKLGGKLCAAAAIIFMISILFASCDLIGILLDTPTPDATRSTGTTMVDQEP